MLVLQPIDYATVTKSYFCQSQAILKCESPFDAFSTSRNRARGINVSTSRFQILIQIGTVACQRASPFGRVEAYKKTRVMLDLIMLSRYLWFSVCISAETFEPFQSFSLRSICFSIHRMEWKLFLNHCTTSKRLFSSAKERAPFEQPSLRLLWSQMTTGRCPLAAAKSIASYVQPSERFLWSHCTRSKCQFVAA